MELQQLVDRLADRAGRPALVEDRRQRVVCYSAHAEPMDEVRRSSILRRSTTPEVIAFFARYAITTARRPVRTPAEPELGLLPRVCVPVWHADLLLGFVWFVDEPPLTGPDLTIAEELAADLALALYRVNLLGELAAQREAEAMRGLLGPDSARSVAALLDEGLLAGDGPVVALVATDPDPAVLEAALAGTRRFAGEAVHLVRPEHGLLLVRVHRTPVAEIAAHLAAGVRGAVGVGDVVGSLGEFAVSARQARQAHGIAVRLATAPVATWSELGIYRVLAAAEGIEIHPGLAALPPELAATVEIYLDLAGDAAATANRLNIHRTTLYYRLARISELAGVDLRDGTQRLALHLACKATHLTH
ncbi:PucR family transcriptional regulator [Hamadaea tsunoensis]|uniref:PucR family transcriptional regulator n=1 Tax=Hamadaea tsunoensis TaxID=53368 RepID=UPI000487E9FA|nr:helix-turn-helix domain-containing protein [Hamadaea tsunoensis]